MKTDIETIETEIARLMRRISKSPQMKELLGEQGRIDAAGDIVKAQARISRANFCDQRGDTRTDKWGYDRRDN